MPRPRKKAANAVLSLATIICNAKDRRARQLKPVTEQRKQGAKQKAMRKDARAVSVASSVQASATKLYLVLVVVSSTAVRCARAE